MRNVKLLDCTLRDGGYVNSSRFGEKVITGILSELSKSNVEIVECGFLRQGSYDEDVALFPDVESIKNILPQESTKETRPLYVALAQCGKISSEDISVFDGKSLDGIRVAFHPNEIDGAIDLARSLMDKGYMLFMQTVGTSSYSEKELELLIKKINQLCPHALYMVDTLGVMQPKDVTRFFELMDCQLASGIELGFHAHNNLQQAFFNAQALLQLDSPRPLIIDSTVFGIGRGAGNLCTELIMQYLNEDMKRSYDIEPVLEVVDKYILPIKNSFAWGYSPVYYLSACKGCHPNYARFLHGKETLKLTDMARIMDKMLPSRRDMYDEAYIAELYDAYRPSHEEDGEVCFKGEKLYHYSNEKHDILKPQIGKNPDDIVEIEPCVWLTTSADKYNGQNMKYRYVINYDNLEKDALKEYEKVGICTNGAVRWFRYFKEIDNFERQDASSSW